MKTNVINDRLQNLVRGVHEKLRDSNPSLADIRRELSARYSIDLSEYEIGDFVLEAGRRRGYSTTAEKAATASKFATQAAYQAVSTGDKESHLVALEAHKDAARAHRLAAAYHDGQADFHGTAVNSCQARRGVVLTIAELKARKLAEFENQKAHCAGCGKDFAIGDAEQRSAENYTCPNCGENVNVIAGKKEEGDDAQNLEETEAGRIAPDGFGWSLPTEARRKVYNKLGIHPIHEEDDATADTAGTSDNAAPAFLLDCARSAARSFIGGSDTLADVVLYMPSGVHSICLSSGGKPVNVTVEVTPQSANELEKQRKVLEATGNKPFFSIQHNTQIAGFWPSRFFWDTRPDATGQPVSGVWAEGEWSKSGREAVEGKNFRSFSPTFYVDAIRTDPNNPAKVICNPNAKLNLGALENDPAFQSISPLWV